LSCPAHGFEIAEHLLSKQLLFVFSGIPDLTLAGKLEAIGFDHTNDERMFTINCTTITRRKVLTLAQQVSGQSEGMKR
jgi:hypothetical protein